MALEFRLGKVIEQIMIAIGNNEDLSAVFKELDLLKEEILSNGEDLLEKRKVVNEELENKAQQLRDTVRNNKIWLRMMQESLSLALGNKV
jgi:hypothetical protein